MGEPRLTICIPTYNRPEFLSECLQSVLAQTWDDFVVVILDNASTADYSWVLRLRDDPRVVYRRRPVNVGAAGNIALALREYRDTEFLMVFHDDDLMHPRLIEWQLQALANDPHAVLAASELAFFRGGEASSIEYWTRLTGRCTRLASEADLARLLLRGSPIHFGSVVYRCDALKGVTLDTERFGKICDRPLLLDLARKGHVLLFTEPLVLYRVHKGQDARTGTLSATHLMELYGRYRTGLSKSRTPSDAGLFYRVATNELLAAYARLPKSARSGLWKFVAECRTRQLFSVRYLRRDGLAALCDLAGIGWVSRAMYPVALVRTLHPRHRLRMLRKKVLPK